MRKVELNMKEMHKYTVIKNLVDNNGNKKRAAVELGCSDRHINRLCNIYKLQGKEGFSHHNKGCIPVNKLSDEKRQTILYLFETKYNDANWNHLLQLLKENEGINISYFTLYSVLTSAGYLSPKAQRITRKKKAKEIRDKIDANKRLTENEKTLVVCNNILDLEDAHPRLPQAKNAGELMQMDASEFVWFGDKKTTLHGAIDSATGAISLYFDRQETLKGYYGLLKSIINNFGVPYALLTDNRTVFYYNSKKDEDMTKDSFTQFGYTCKLLGIGLSTTSIPQKKGKIERLWNTLQSRLPVEMRLAGIKTIEEANAFLKCYVKEFNKNFALPLNNIKSIFENQPSDEELNNLLATRSLRTFDKGCSIKFQNKYYQAYQDDKLVPFKDGVKALVIITYDGRYLISVDEQMYEMREVLKNKTISEDFPEADDKVVTPRKVYIPPMSHPFKAASFEEYVNRQKHRANNAYV